MLKILLLFSQLVLGVWPELSQKLEFEQKIKEHNLQSQKIIMFIDYGISINKKRFFVYDNRKKKLLYSDYVGHSGRSGRYRPVYTSNQRGSKKTSLGLYKIGTKYVGKYGESYSLFGRSKTNSNAYKRRIIVHTILRPGFYRVHLPNGEIRIRGPTHNKIKYLYSHGCFTFYQESYPDVVSYMKKNRYLIVYR